MFPLGPEGSPEPDIIGTANADRAGRRWPRYVMAGAAVVLAGVIAVALFTSSRQHSTAGRPPSPASASPAGPVPGVVIPSASGPAPPQPGATPSQAWVTALRIANWPMPGSGTGADSTMFAGGVAGNGGWELTVREVTHRGGGCAAEVVLSSGAHPDKNTYPISPQGVSRTPAGDLAFIALGGHSPGVGIAFLQLDASATQVWTDPDRIGGFDIDVAVVTVRACGQHYHLAGFAYPLAGTLDIYVGRDGASPARYLVPTWLSRPNVPGAWHV